MKKNLSADKMIEGAQNVPTAAADVSSAMALIAIAMLLREIRDILKSPARTVHLDGARFANADGFPDPVPARCAHFNNKAGQCAYGEGYAACAERCCVWNRRRGA